MSKHSRRGRAAKTRPLLSVADIVYLSSLGRIGRDEALRELERYMRETLPKDLPQPEMLIRGMVGTCRQYPTTDWLWVFAEFGRRLEARYPSASNEPTAIIAELPDGRVLTYVANSGLKS